MFISSRGGSRLWALAMVLATGLAACAGHNGNASTPPVTEPRPSVAISAVGSPGTTAPPSSAAPTTITTVPPTTAVPTTTTLPPLPPGSPATRISRGSNGTNIVALSFDAGADVGYSAQILDLLKAEGVHASFGVTGKWAEKNPDVFVRIVAEGHHLINHTYDHQSMTGRSTGKLPLNRAARADELRHADDIFMKIGGVSAKPWFRPPYGDIDSDLDKQLVEEGYRYDTLWSVDSLGWKGLAASAIVTRCDNGLQPGAIFLFHVGTQSQDAAALPSIIKAIRAAGMQPGSVRDVV